MRKRLTRFIRILERGEVQLVFEKGSKRGSRNKRKKRDFAVSIRTCRATCYLHHPSTCLASQALSFESAQSRLALLEQRARVHPIFSSSPGLAASLRSHGFFSGPGPCASSEGRLPEALFFLWFFYWIQKVQKCTLARNAFHGVSIGFRRCKRV